MTIVKEVPLGECCQVVGGGTPRTSEPSYWEGSIPWATPKDLSELSSRYIAHTARNISHAGLKHSGARMLPAGSVLLSSRAPIGLVAINQTPMATNQGFKSLIPDPNRVDTNYLAWWLQSHTTGLQAIGNGATFKEISKEVVSRIKIRLPPLREQRRIARILDAVDHLRAKRRSAIQHGVRLESSIFREMFGEPFANRRGWALHPLGGIADKFSDGPFGSNLKSVHYTDDGIRVVRLQNIGVGEFIDRDRAFISPSHFAGLRKHECQPGDILIATMGDPNLRACVLPESVGPALNKADCVQMRVDASAARNRYVCALLNDPGTLARARVMMAGQTRVRISMGRLRDLRVPVPPPDRQDHFARCLAASDEARQAAQAHLAHLDALFASLQHRAFAGEL